MSEKDCVAVFGVEREKSVISFSCGFKKKIEKNLPKDTNITMTRFMDQINI